MIEWTVDIRVKVSTEDPAQAAMLCAHLFDMAAEAGMPVQPQFVGVRPIDRAPDGIDAIIEGANGPTETAQAPHNQARGVFDGIMQAPPM